MQFKVVKNKVISNDRLLIGIFLDVGLFAFKAEKLDDFKSNSFFNFSNKILFEILLAKVNWKIKGCC
jgi:hypothetical protein